MDEQHLKDHYEDIVILRDANYANVKMGLDITRQFIIKHNLILIGGMAIDLALKSAGHDGIYRDDKLPDYDFISPDIVLHSSKLGSLVCKAGLPNISVITALHTTTRRVRVDFFSVADIGYCPQNIYDIIPYITYHDMRIIHPHFQMMDIHHSLSYPFENPSMPVVSHRWKRDMVRYDILFEMFPITTTSTLPKMKVCELPPKLIKGACITGWAALSYWHNKKIEIPDGAMVHILDDDYSKWAGASEKEPVYISSRFGKMPRSVIVIINGITFEVFDNLGEKVSAEKVGSFYVANLQHVMMTFLTKKYLEMDTSIHEYYDAAYLKAYNMVIQKNAPPGIIPSISVYGSAIWSESYLINRREFAAKLNNIKLSRIDKPPSVFPSEPQCKSAVVFDYKESPYYDISGNTTSQFIPKKVEYFGTTDIISESYKYATIQE
jgi:hypothetical protein